MQEMIPIVRSAIFRDNIQNYKAEIRWLTLLTLTHTNITFRPVHL